MKRIKKYLAIAYEKCTKKDWDEVLCICGYNGKGKTHLGFHIMEEWLRLQGKEITPDMVHQHVGMDSYSFAKILDGAKKYDVVMDDEAGDINSRQAMGKVNKLYMEAYQVIRAENLFTIIIIPDYFMLDPYFRKHRVRHLIEVTKRGSCRFWDQRRLHRLNDYNSGKDFKSYNIVPSTFVDNFPIYRGAMFAEYQKLKTAKMAGVRKKLFSEVCQAQDIGQEGQPMRVQRRFKEQAIMKMYDAGSSVEEIAEELMTAPKGIIMAIRKQKVLSKLGVLNVNNED